MMPRSTRRLALRSLAAIGTLTLALSAGAPARPAVAQPTSAHRHGQLILRLHPEAAGAVEELQAQLGATAIPLAPGANVYLFELPPDADPGVLSVRLDDDRRIVYAEPNYLSQPPEALPRNIGAWGGLDPSPMPVQPAADLVRLREAGAISTGTGVKVAIVDTGAQLDHPFLAGALAADGYDFLDDDDVPEDERDGQDNDGDGYADEAFGHGTHVAGIVRLVAPDAELLILRALDADGLGDVFTVARAIYAAVDSGADVINLSLGTPSPSLLLAEAVAYAAISGVFVAAAAGNAASSEPQYPAASPCVLAVTAIDAEGRLSSFGNRGSWVFVGAPGESIFSAYPPGGFAWATGTSMATPFVAGQAALLRALQPELSPAAIATVIVLSAHPVENQEEPGRAVRRIDLAASLDILGNWSIDSGWLWRRGCAVSGTN